MEAWETRTLRYEDINDLQSAILKMYGEGWVVERVTSSKQEPVRAEFKKLQSIRYDDSRYVEELN